MSQVSFIPVLGRAQTTSRRILAIAFFSLGLVACGGSSKDKKPVVQVPATPAVSVSVSNPKELKFTWNAVTGATSYKFSRNAGGNSGYETLAEGNITSATDVVAVHLHDWANTLYRVEACNQAGCTSSEPILTTNLVLNAIGKLQTSDPAANDYLGYSVAVSGDGNYLAVGLTNRDLALSCDSSEAECLTPVSNAGAVQIYKNVAGSWDLEAELKVAVGAVNANNYFGYSLALSSDGDTLAVGTPYEASSAQGINGERDNASEKESGAVYVFSRSGSQWTEQAYIKASNAEAYDYFGQSVALSEEGDVLVVGAPGEASKAVGINGDELNNERGVAGAAYVFTRTEGVWVQEAYVKASAQVYFTSPCFNPSPVRCLTTHGGFFGFSIALSGDGQTLAVGAIYQHTDASGINIVPDNWDARHSGAAYIFVKENGEWEQQAFIKASNNRTQTNFGYRVTLNGNGDVLAVSSIKESSDGSNRTDTSADSAGAVYVYARVQNEWDEVAYLKASNVSAQHEFGSSLALTADGRQLAVGASLETGDSAGINGNETSGNLAGAGAVYLFEQTGNEWVQRRYIKSAAPASQEKFGSSLGLSANGKLLVVGAPGTKATVGDNSHANAGAAWIY